MEQVLGILFTVIWLATGIYISHTVMQHYHTYFHAPWDIVRFWKIYRKTGEKWLKWVIMVHLASLAAAITVLCLFI